MNHTDISEICAGLILANRLSPNVFQPEDFKEPFDQVVRLAKEGKEIGEVMDAVGIGPVHTAMAASDTIPRSDNELGRYVNLLETISLRADAGFKLERMARALMKGDLIDIAQAEAVLSHLDHGTKTFRTMDQVEPKTAVWVPSYFPPIDDFVGGWAYYGLNLFGAPPGCLSGDTIIDLNRAGRSFKCRLDELVLKFNGGKESGRGRGWDQNIPTYVRSLGEDGILHLNQLTVALDSGMKYVYRLMLSTGQTIKGTFDHPILTEHGWSQLGSLEKGELVYVDMGQKGYNPTGNHEYIYIEGLRYHPHASKKQSNRYAVLYHHLVVEADLNKITILDLINRCRMGTVEGLKFLSPDTLVHHKDHDQYNNSLSNLEITTSYDHALRHAQEGTWKNVMYKAGLVRVEKVEFVGLEHTYDLGVGNEPHNFIANGIVVHNTGKTSLVARILANTIKNKKKAAFLSLEMLASIVKARMNEIDPTLTEEDYSYLTISEEVFTFDEAYTEIAKLKAANPDLYLVAIDFADLMVPDDREESTEVAGRIYKTLASLAKKLCMPILLISQLSRAYAGGIPHINHIRWSGLAEATATNIYLLYNPNKVFVDQGENRREPQLRAYDGKGYLIVGKSRFGTKMESIGAIMLDWDGKRGWGEKGNWVPLSYV